MTTFILIGLNVGMLLFFNAVEVCLVLEGLGVKINWEEYENYSDSSDG